MNRPWRIALACTVITFGLSASARAQVSPTAPPYPTMPWSPLRHAEGQVLRYIAVPPQQVVIEVLGPAAPAAAPPSEPSEGATAEPVPEAAAPALQLQQQVVQIPGYTVAVTTTGYLLPERWTLQQLGPGAYQWVKLPSELRSQWP